MGAGGLEFKRLGNHLTRVAPHGAKPPKGASPDHISVQPLPRRPFSLLALLPPSPFSFIAQTMR